MTDPISVKEHPLLLSGPMVLAALAGRKHVTRRILSKRNTLIDGKPWSQSKCKWNHMKFDRVLLKEGKLILTCTNKCDTALHTLTPIYQPGDAVWFKETWTAYGDSKGNMVSRALLPSRNCSGGVIYRTDHPGMEGPWRSSMFMPRWACRLVRPVTGSHIERVQNITEEQAEREGVERVYPAKNEDGEEYFLVDNDGTFRCGFQAIWEHLRPNPGQHWQDNPIVVVIEFGDKECDHDD